ncbi:uncharacterized membrane protein At3g27390 isoform X2 [Rhodamnia argentea]|uniref:Uncharacterized membrane protein At3g27390 isoform X2 n=1 Tax=Rhodamnia argentea TaxID=178133 RepID=A0ABM3HSG1_9MYRT|nr:uncharacterized membrane protein At3g27390 isoform X2 [Rhodamnia argentea]
MEPPRGVLTSLWHFICFLPYFTGLLLLGTIKGIIFCPLACLILTVGNSGITLGLWPVHAFWTCYSVFRAQQLGPILKLIIFICIPAPLIVWPVVAIAGSFIGGAAYGFFSPIFATFEAIGEGKDNKCFHCFHDGTWSTIQGSFTIVRDFWDCCFHSYFSLMDDLRHQEPPERKYHEIRVLYLPGAILAGVIGFMVDMPMISVIAMCKSPYMLFKGWHRLFHDLIGREGPFLETICVPFAGLAIILWPMAVVGALLGSIVSSMFLGAYAGVVAYQESSLWLGLCYIIASLSFYDEYSNDVLDMPEGSLFPRPNYRRNPQLARTSSFVTSLAGSSSTRNPPSRTVSFKSAVVDLKPLELLRYIFKEIQRHGERMVSEGLITSQDIEDAKSDGGSRVLSTGLPAYCIFQTLLRSAKANSAGILLCEDVIELTVTNRPKDVFFDWFLNPLLIIKDQVKAENLTTDEDDYLGKLVLLSGDPARLRNSSVGSPPESELKRAELDGLARRLRGITKSISRYPTFRRHFDNLVDILSEDLAKKDFGSKSTKFELRKLTKSRSLFVGLLSQKSFKSKTKDTGSCQEPEQAAARDIEVV